MYYKLPKKLFDEKYKDVSIACKVVYAVILQRFKENAKFDETGNRYCIYTQNELVKDIGCYKTSIQSYLRLLVKYGLIEKYGRFDYIEKANRIYLKEI